MNSNDMYAKPKRRKPVPKSVKSSPAGVKSNPSKRHRERVNEELERLASQLPFPQDVISKLDKLTVLRLSVGYLRAKSFFSVALESNSCQQVGANCSKTQGEELLEGELLLQVLNGFLLVVTAEGIIFYASSTLKDYLGFHQSDVMYQSVYELVHAEDRSEFQRQLHWALHPDLPAEASLGNLATKKSSLPLTYSSPAHLPPENSTFLKRNFVCRLRCLLDNSTGFLGVNIQGHLKFLHGQNQKAEDGSLIPPQLALFALAIPLQPPPILEIRTRSFIFRTKHKLDFTPLACEARGKLVLGYTDAELCDRGTGYQFIHAADMLYCAENHIRMMKTGESGMTVFRLLNKQSRWLWVQANARLIYRNGRPEYIIATQKVITDEEGEDNLRKRNLKLPFSFTTGEAVLYDTSLLKSLSGPTLGKTTAIGLESTCSEDTQSLDPGSLLSAIMKQNDSVCVHAQNQASSSHELTDMTGDLGHDHSSDWQNNTLGFSIHRHLAEDKNRDLLNFMTSLGVCKEDLELFHKDEEFFHGCVLENCDVMEVADDIMSHVGDTLMKKSDYLLSSGLQSHCDQTSTTGMQGKQSHTLSHGNQQQPLPEACWQQPVLPLCPDSSSPQQTSAKNDPQKQECKLELQQPQTFPQIYREQLLHQPQVQTCTPAQWSHACAQTQLIINRQPCDVPQEQLCCRLTCVQVSGEGCSVVQPPAPSHVIGHPAPSFIHPYEPSLQQQVSTAHECFSPVGSHLGVSHESQPGLLPVSHTQGTNQDVLSSQPSGALTVAPGDLDLEELLGSLDSASFGGQTRAVGLRESNVVTTSLCESLSETCPPNQEDSQWMRPLLLDAAHWQSHLQVAAMSTEFLQNLSRCKN